MYFLELFRNLDILKQNSEHHGLGYLLTHLPIFSSLSTDDEDDVMEAQLTQPRSERRSKAIRSSDTSTTGDDATRRSTATERPSTASTVGGRSGATDRAKSLLKGPNAQAHPLRWSSQFAIRSILLRSREFDCVFLPIIILMCNTLSVRFQCSAFYILLISNLNFPMTLMLWLEYARLV